MAENQHSNESERRAPEAADVAAAGSDASAEGQPVEGPRDVDENARISRERDEYLDHLRRLQAEFDNYRKRVQRDKEELRLRAAETVVESLLPVVDNLARALQAAERHEQSQLLDGLRLVADQLRGTLTGHGLTELEVAPGSEFDPTYHEAVLTQESEEMGEGQVIQVLERGYLLHGKLLRPAKVIVAR